jgi:hypothetical protein
MARILICHVPKDGSLARDMGSALMGRGHFVSFDGEADAPRPDRAARLRQFETVIVVWTEFSAQSPGLAEIARDTLPLNVLVPVKSPDLDLARIPLAFRKLNMLAPRDSDAIARLVARLSSAASSLREMTEREAQRKRAAPPVAADPPSLPPLAANPNATRSPAAHAAPAPSAQSVQARSRAEPVVPPPLPERRAAVRPPSPVVEPAAGARARPLTGLPEVSADPSLFSAPPAHLSTPAGAQEPPSPPLSQAPSPYQPPSAPPPAVERSADTMLTADDLIRAIDEGLLVYHLPDAMWLGEPVTVEIALGRGILGALFDYEERQSIETISISLYGHAEAFEIARQSERTQFVGEARPTQAWRDPGTYGRWTWLVTPHAAGPQDLVVRVSALLRDRRGVPGPVALPDQRFAIDIQIPEGESLVSALAGWRRR